MVRSSLRTVRFLFQKKVLRNWRSDFPASIVVFLVALPLCLGISIASNAPVLAGMLTGIVAGLVVTWISGSELSVSGPAAGLTTIVAYSIATLGNYETFLTAVVLSGAIQIIFGLLRSGFISSVIPMSVIKGMLAAIGITIILKQIPEAFGGMGTFQSEVKYIRWTQLEHFGANFNHLLNTINYSALIIALGSLAVLHFWTEAGKNKKSLFSKIPASLVAVLFGAVINLIFSTRFPSLALYAQDGHLVQLPIFTTLAAFFSEMRTPDFSGIYNSSVWLAAFTIACVGSIETLLCLESTDKLDPYHRVSNPNRELLAQGVGNVFAGLIGGIPMTSVIVRSSANVYSGAKSRLSSFLHGCLLLLSILALSRVLNFIPLAALAAVLIMVGYKLAHPSLFSNVYKSGLDQFVPFIVTIIAILLTDLLNGVMIGVGIGLLLVIRSSYYSAVMVIHDGINVLVRFTKDVTFIHKAKLRKELAQIKDGSHVYIDGSRAMFLDHDILEILQEFQQGSSHRKLHIETRGITEKKSHIPQFRNLRPFAKERTRHHGVVQETSFSQ